jgi:hypothetical protein
MKKGRLNLLFLILILLSITSCLNKKNEANMNIIGSTIENINNSKYSGVEFNIEDEYCVGTINEYFKGYKNKVDFPYSLWITVETKDKNNDGHPTGEESFLFNQIEDGIIEKLDKKTPYCYIGHITRNGYREIMFYISDNSEVSKLIDTFIAENKYKRQIKYSIELDKNWESVSGFIE